MFEQIKAVLGYLLGSEPVIVYVLLVVMAVDYVTGVCAAIYHHALSSNAGYKGITKKIAVLCIIILAHIIGTYVMADSNVLRNATAMFYISNEVVSVLENATRLGLPLPGKLKQAFAAMKAQDEKRDHK